MSHSPYTPPPDSLAERVVAHLRKRPREEISRGEVRKFFKVATLKDVEEGLQKPLQHGWLKAITYDGEPSYLLGPKGHTEAQAGTAAPPAVTPTIGIKGKPPNGLRPLNIQALPVHTDMPVPKLRTHAMYDALFVVLVKPGMCRTGIPIEYRRSVAIAAGRFAKEMGWRLSVHPVDSATVGVWRTA